MMDAWKAGKAAGIALCLVVGVALVELVSTNRHVQALSLSGPDAVATPAVATTAASTPALATPALATPALATPAVATPAVAIDVALSTDLEAAAAASTASLDLLLAPIAGGDSRADSYRLERDSCCIGN